MNKQPFFLSCLLFLSFFAGAQTYSGPESAEYDYANRRWLVGNTSTHQILIRDSTNQLSIFVSSTTTGPYGLEIVGDTLFCCSGGSIKGYSLATGTLVYNVNLGAAFLNGLTHDNSGNLITTDFNAKKIYLLNIAAQTFLAITGVLTQAPNGIVYDLYNNRCVFVNWGASAPIKAIDLTTHTVTTLLNTSLSNCDGITRDGEGRYYVTNWGLSSILRYDSSFAAPPTTVATGLSSPADIFYNVVDDTLAIPNAGNSTVLYVGFASTVGISSVDRSMKSVCFPNPAAVGEVINIQAAGTNYNTLELTDVTGRIVRKQNVTNGVINIETEGLLPGMYHYRLTNSKNVSTGIIIIY